MTSYTGSITQWGSFENEFSNDDILQLLMFSNFREQLNESAQELHNLTDRITYYQVSHSVTPVETYDMVLPLMALLIESRERAKRIYRDALDSRMDSKNWDIDPLFERMQVELFRTQDLLRLYPRKKALW
ncbi:uncharacterized protein ZBIST_0418 [Zygosaccharomyces bailii]|uniref:BN860_12772g1_1 n=1 Tax=Zygosaccharomyces bailii (strain CLIB 213 / ATCC 58445 / CBS 680 / BCRC 21525 / NBRC 1098 / NCYC 1416 / NRRL Y-2227) TaxID=1333698 RepID=A0A8J2WXA7_ZYGB2|nr:BN860_12772g1_1 [Zygosaccharomyces bailii CLIB 213]CDH14577.1 uncharacterized protein ZBAI_06363 [Zygosaccharomyces bailii ISA1307]SJM82307.1 uncharacterized protein ZBIST_0418 [Zygosaccharomyces bailii]